MLGSPNGSTHLSDLSPKLRGLRSYKDFATDRRSFFVFLGCPRSQSQEAWKATAAEHQSEVDVLRAEASQAF